MKIIFIENRYNVYIWDEVINYLEKNGHHIHWIIQNPAFIPKYGTPHIIRFPKHQKDGAKNNPIKTPAIKSDRIQKYFGGKTDHYKYYTNEIEELIEKINPAIIFGEATLFHELISIEISKQKKIPYIFPTSTRYPPNRICFHSYDTLKIIGGSKEKLSEKNATELRDAILNRCVIPSYMTQSNPRALHGQTRKILDKLKISVSWMKGERFNTPNPFWKYIAEKKANRVAKKWDLASKSGIKDIEHPFVLYALQMQPEANIDTWGHPWNDQTRIIKEAATELSRHGIKLVVKPNPKSKYELNEELLNTCLTHKNIIPLKRSVKMQDIFTDALGVISVTGTIIIECVISGKPVAALGDHPIADYPGVLKIESPSQLSDFINQIQNKSHKPATSEETIKLLMELTETSYAGTIYCPLNQPELGTKKNLNQIANAVNNIIEIHVRTTNT